MSVPVVVLPRVGRAARLLLLAVLTAALTVPGVVAAPSASADHMITAAERRPNLRYGSEGDAVLYVQHRLDVSGPTGYFGPKTRAAVNRLKGKHGWRQNGVVGRRVWVALLGPEGTRHRRASRSHDRASALPGTAAFGKLVVRTARRTAAGARYVYGSTGPKTFDCSGFVGYVHRRLGKTLPRTSRDIRSATRVISRSSVRPGDLVFVHTGGRVTHVGIVSRRLNYWWEASNPRSGVGVHRAWTSSVSYGRVR